MKHQLLAKNKAREDEKMLFKARWFLAICLWSMATDHWLMVTDPLALGVIALSNSSGTWLANISL